MFDQVDRFVEAARQIQRAASVDEIARALAGAIPDCDAPTHGALDACLRSMEISQAQRAARSLEIAYDLRLDARRRLTRLLCARADRELSSNLAELAVQSVSALTATPGIARAVAGVDRPDAFAGLGGAIFISAQARGFATAQGLDDTALNALLAAALEPIRRACNVDDACSLGELRFCARHGAVEASAMLHRASTGSPLIRIRLHRTGESPGLPPQPAPEPDYTARVLRSLVK